MNNSDLEYLDKLVIRFKGYKSPTDTQILLMMLCEKANRNPQDDKDLKVLLTAEKKAEELLKARTAARNLINTVKEVERKAEVRKKIIWGAALKKAAEKDPRKAQIMLELFNEGFISDKDKDAVRDDLIMPVTTPTEPSSIPDDVVTEPEGNLNLSRLSNRPPPQYNPA